MKKIYLLILTILMISCDESHFANSVMKDIGNGRYAQATSGGVYSDEVLDLLNSTKAMDILNNEDVFSLADIHDKEANQKIKIENWENSFDIDVMFDNFNLVESQHLNEDLLRLVTIPKNGDENLIIALRMGQDMDKETDKNYLTLSEYSYLSTAYANIDKYRMKYKITVNQTDRIAYLTVIKIPKKGYRVTSFVIM